VSILASRPPPKELGLWSRLAKRLPGPDVVSVKTLPAAARWLFREDAELPWLAVAALQLSWPMRPAPGVMAASPSLWGMELIPVPGWQL